jgi:ERCC4-type nuclease
MTAAPVRPPLVPVLASRGGTQIKAPKPVLLIDTKEKFPFDFHAVSGWFSGIEKKALHLGDYAIQGMEDACVVERKSIEDLVSSFTAERSVFVKRLQNMAKVPNRLLVIDGAWSQVKSKYDYCGVDPNWITQSLIAAVAGLGVPFICCETHELGAELVALYLQKVHLYAWLEANDFERCLSDNDL